MARPCSTASTLARLSFGTLASGDVARYRKRASVRFCPPRLGVDNPPRLVTPCLQEPQTSPLSDTPPSASPSIPSRLFECGGSQHLRHTHRPGSSSAALTFSGIGEPPGPCKSSLSNTRCTLHPTPSLPPADSAALLRYWRGRRTLLSIHTPTIPPIPPPLLRHWRGRSTLLPSHADGGELQQPAGRICTWPLRSSSCPPTSSSRPTSLAVSLRARHDHRHRSGSATLGLEFRSWLPQEALPRLDGIRFWR